MYVYELNFVYSSTLLNLLLNEHTDINTQMYKNTCNEDTQTNFLRQTESICTFMYSPIDINITYEAIVNAANIVV